MSGSNIKVVVWKSDSIPWIYIVTLISKVNKTYCMFISMGPCLFAAVTPIWMEALSSTDMATAASAPMDFMIV